MPEKKVELLPFTVPNYVIGKMPPRPKQDGIIEAPKWALSELEPAELSELCDLFRADAFKKAGFRDPVRR